MKKCPNCNGEVKDTAKFCKHCGCKIEQKQICPQCGATLDCDSDFCEECGANLKPDAKVFFGTGKADNCSTANDDPWAEVDDDPWLAIDNQVNALAKSKDGKYQLGMECDLNEQYNQAFDNFKQAAELGHAEAQFMLGTYYRDGKGCAMPDRDKACEWFFKSAENGSLAGMVYAGEICQYTYKNPQKAKEWYQKAATQNYADGVVHLAQLVFSQNKEQYAYAIDMVQEACRTHNKVAKQGLISLCNDVVDYLNSKMKKTQDNLLKQQIMQEIKKYESLAKMYSY